MVSEQPAKNESSYSSNVVLSLKCRSETYHSHLKQLHGKGCPFQSNVRGMVKIDRLLLKFDVKSNKCFTVLSRPVDPKISG